MHEDDPEAAQGDGGNNVLVEINLTSNDDVLGIRGKFHPFPTYRKFGVPVAISTDDEGIERIDLSNEYVRAVESYDLTYADLKQIARASLEHSFLPGASLCQERDVFTAMVLDCRGDTAGGISRARRAPPSFEASQKATQQWELEWRFSAFERLF